MTPQSRNPQQTKGQFSALKNLPISIKPAELEMISGLLEQIRPEVPSQDGIAYSAEVVESNIPNCAVEAHVYPDWEITACATTTVGRWDIATTEVDLAARTVTVRLNPHPDCGEEDFKMLVIHFVPKYAEGAKLPARPQ